MKVNKKLKWTLKILSAVISFLLIFFFIQPFFVPKYLGDSTTIVDGYSYIEDNSIDVLFLGASQMFCSVDAGRLTEKYGISSYDFGASSQYISITPYYFDTALKTQSPKLIMIEVCALFLSNKSIDAPTISWSYDPMGFSIEKFNSLKSVLDGDTFTSFKYTVVPLLQYHDRWSSRELKELEYVFNKEKYIDTSTRGFLAREHIEPHKIAFLDNDLSEREIPEENKNAISYIAAKCKEKGIKLVFFKTPVSNDWSRGDCNSVKKYMNEVGLEYIDLNESLDIIGIDGDKDFYNKNHLNTSGAEKTTDYLAKIISDNYLN